MADPTRTPILPKAQAPIAGAFPATREFLDFFRDLLGRVNEDEGLRAELEALIIQIEAILATQIIGPQSVQVFGSISQGLVTLMLRNDEPLPSPLFYYGTDPVGNKGWQPAASLVEYLVDENGDYLVDENGNFLISIDITADLFAIVETSPGILAHTGVGTWEARTLTEGAGIDITDGDGVAGNPTIAHEDTSSVANLTSDNSGTVVLQDIAFTFDTFGHVLTATAGTVDVATALTGTFQPLDATLTALAGQNWAANALPIGSGADTVAQVAFAANTFPARASTGNLVAKPITDFGLSLADDADAATARTTLGLASSTYTPTLTDVTNVASSSSATAQYMQVGDVVTVSGLVNIDPTAAATASELGISLPVASLFTAGQQCCGTAAASAVASLSGRIVADAANDRASLQWVTTADVANRQWSFHFTYRVI